MRMLSGWQRAIGGYFGGRMLQAGAISPFSSAHAAPLSSPATASSSKPERDVTLKNPRSGARVGDEKGDIAAGLKHPAAEISADGAGANHEHAHC